MKIRIIEKNAAGTDRIRRMFSMLLVFSLAAVMISAAPAEKAYAAAAAQASVVSIKADTLWGRTGAGEEFEKYGICVRNSSYRCYDSKRAADGSLWYKVKDEKGSYFWLDSKYAENYNASSGVIYSAESYYGRQVVPKKALTLYAEARPDSGTVAGVGPDCSLCVIGDGVGSDNRSWFKVVCGNRTGWISREDVNIYNLCDPVPERVFSPQRTPVIYLSPSNQTGNPYAAGDTNEHIQCQAIAVELKRILEERYDCVVYIADQMLALSASGRPSEAASLGSDIYLAIHTNASGGGTGYGPQAYYYPGGEQSRVMGENLAAAMKAASPFSSTVTNVINGMNYLSGYGYGEVRSPGALGMVALLFEVEYHDNADSANWIIGNTSVIAGAIADGLNKTFSFPAKGSSLEAASTAPDAAPAAEPQAPGTTADAAVNEADNTTAAAAAEGGSGDASAPTEPKAEEPVRTLTGRELAELDEAGFFEALAPVCRRDMAENGVLASLTLAQAAIESDFGKSELSVNANNLFGMKQTRSGNKWDSVWKGDLYLKVVQDEKNGVIEGSTQQYRAYGSVNESVRDHSRYLIGATVEEGLRYGGIQGETDYRKAARIVANDSYDPDGMYEELIAKIEGYGLTKYDTENYVPTSATTTTAAAPTPQEEIKIQTVEFAGTPSEMLIGRTAVLVPVITPVDASESVSWSSSNTAVARVDASGKVTAIGAGKVRVTVHAAACDAVCEITVKPDVKPEMIGAGICITEPYGIRFATRIQKNIAWESVDAVSMGTLIIPKDALGDAALTLENDKALNVPSTRKHSENDTEFVFTGKLSGITSESFDRRILARGYVIYRNVDGSESALYSDICESSFREVAKDSLKVYQGLPEGTPERDEMIDKLNMLIMN